MEEAHGLSEVQSMRVCWQHGRGARSTKLGGHDAKQNTLTPDDETNLVGILYLRWQSKKWKTSNAFMGFYKGRVLLPIGSECIRGRSSYKIE